uniref:PRR15 protein n=1 Tax=Varanus komodoensis TaxID=61221 RepID=A0A8D2LB08_VARKO
TNKGGSGAKTSSSGTWWKSLTSKKKSKESPPGAPGTAWPPLPMQPAEPTELIHALPNPPDSRDTQQPPLGSGSRRNLKISRSGRFKEKRKVRATLLAESPQVLFEGAGGGGAASCAAPAHPGEKAPCQ